MWIIHARYLHPWHVCYDSPLVFCIFALLACLPWFIWLLALSHHPCYTLTCFLGLMTYVFMPLTWYILFIVACLQLLHLLIVETWTLYLWCMLAWLSLLYLVVLASYASILCNTPLSFLMMSMMHTLVGYLTTWMLGFAFPLTSFVFPSVCHVLSIEGFTRWYNHETFWLWEGILDAQLHHPWETPKGDLLPFEPSSSTHIGWAILSLLFPSCCLHDTSIGWRTGNGDGPYGPSSWGELGLSGFTNGPPFLPQHWAMVQQLP